MILRYFVIMFFADKGKGTVGILWMQGAPVLETISVQDERREREFKRRVQFVLLHGATWPH